jgi:hypothetical protein
MAAGLRASTFQNRTAMAPMEPAASTALVVISQPGAHCPGVLPGVASVVMMSPAVFRSDGPPGSGLPVRQYAARKAWEHCGRSRRNHARFSRTIPNVCADDLYASRDFYVRLLGFSVHYDSDW